MSLNVEKGNRKRIVVVGGGFGGLQVANGLKGSDYQVILIDKTIIISFHHLFIKLHLQGWKLVRFLFPFAGISRNVRIFTLEWPNCVPFIPKKNLFKPL